MAQVLFKNRFYAKIDTSGKITITAQDIGIQGAEIIGSDVYIKSENRILIIPSELYFETIKYGRKFYSKYQELRNVESWIIAKGDEVKAEQNALAIPSGNIVIKAKKDLAIKAGKYQALNTINLISEEGRLIVESVSNWQRLKEITKKKQWFAKKVTTRKTYEETPNLVEFNAANINIETKDNQQLIGVNIIAKTAKLIAGTAEHLAAIAILPATKISEIEIKTKTSGFVFKFANRGITFIEKKRSAKGNIHIVPMPSLLQVEDEFYVYASGRYMHVQPMFLADKDNLGKLKGIINAKDIYLQSAPSLHTEYTYLNKMGAGMGFHQRRGMCN